MEYIEIGELRNIPLCVLTYFDFTHEFNTESKFVLALFNIIDEEILNIEEYDFESLLKKSKSNVCVSLNVALLVSISAGAIFKNGIYETNNSRYTNTIELKNVDFSKSKSYSIREYLNLEFKIDYFRFIRKEFMDSNILVFKNLVIDGEIVDIIIPKPLIFLRFTAVSTYSLENIINHGLPLDNTNPIFLEIKENTNEKKIGIYLKKNIPNNQAAFWAMFIFYPKLREYIHKQKQKFNLNLIKNPQAKIPFEIDWPLEELIESICFNYRSSYKNNKKYIIVSSIEKIISEYNLSNIHIESLRENDNRRKNITKDTKAKKNKKTINRSNGNTVTTSVFEDSNKKATDNVENNIKDNWLTSLPDCKLINVNDQKWKTETKNLIKDFNSTSIGQDNIGSFNLSYNEEIVYENDNPFRYFKDVFNEINKRNEYSFSKHNFLNVQNIHIVSYSKILSICEQKKLNKSDVENCLKPIHPNLKLNKFKRLREYSIIEGLNKNKSFHILEIEPNRGKSEFCYVFKGKTIEEVHEFMIEFIKSNESVKDINKKGLFKYDQRIKHPIKHINDKDKYVQKFAEKLINIINLTV